MPDNSGLLSQVYVEIDGQPAPEEFVRDFLSVTVETSLHLPDVATMIINDRRGRWVDDERLAPGKALLISAKVTQQRHTLFDGEIVELEPEYIPGKQHLTVRAFDRLHRLARGRHVRSFQNVTDGDLVARIAKEANLQSKVARTSRVHEYVLQDNQTNLQFLADRAAALGYLLYVREQTLHCEPPGSEASAVELHWGKTLGEFRPRLTTVGQADSATVRGWDPTTRQEIVGHAQNGKGAPLTTDDRSGSSLAKNAFNMSAEALVTDRVVRSQTEADRLAQTVMDRVASNFIVAEGVGSGNPAVTAGASVQLVGLGKRFDGTYFVTGATHTYGHDAGYTTHFSVSGHRPATLLSCLRPEDGDEERRMPGLTIGIVTDNQDASDLGRVKLRYPSLSADHASDWARVAAPGGGPDRGLQFLPEVNDEVLVGFEHGDVHHPYVLGGLWNGKDAPPGKSSQVISSGNVQQRVIRSRLGHTITLDDSTDRPGITIVDKTGDNTIHIDSSSNKLTLSVKGDLTLEAQGTVSIQGKSVQVQATNDVQLSGASAAVQAKQSLTLKGATADLEGSTSTTVKGGSVSIN
ncbi:MAG: VgrG-related protein [Chloroflexota bacterium]